MNGLDDQNRDTNTVVLIDEEGRLLPRTNGPGTTERERQLIALVSDLPPGTFTHLRDDDSHRVEADLTPPEEILERLRRGFVPCGITVKETDPEGFQYLITGPRRIKPLGTFDGIFRDGIGGFFLLRVPGRGFAENDLAGVARTSSTALRPCPFTAPAETLVACAQNANDVHGWGFTEDVFARLLRTAPSYYGPTTADAPPDEAYAAPLRRENCPDCKGRKEIMLAFSIVTCDTCDDDGMVPVD